MQKKKKKRLTEYTECVALTTVINSLSLIQAIKALLSPLSPPLLASQPACQYWVVTSGSWVKCPASQSSSVAFSSFS